jgi:hypothetical protein
MSKNPTQKNPAQSNQQTPQSQNLPGYKPGKKTAIKPKKPRKKSKILKVLLFVILITIVLGSLFLTHAIAYEKVKLTQFPKVQKTISHFVQSISFMPKTPKFLLEKSAIAHQEVTKHSFDISAALDSNELISSLGMGSLDLMAKGRIDYSDSKNLILDMNASITRDFSFEVKKKDVTVYFRINKIPPLLLTFLDLQPEQLEPLLNKWVAYDAAKLDTSARKQIEIQERESLSAKFLEESVQKYFDGEVFAKTKVETVEEDKVKLYKLTVNADAELIDHIGEIIEKESKENLPPPDYEAPKDQKLSDTVKKLSWEIYIDKKDYYTRKVAMFANLELAQATSAETAITNPMLPLLNDSTASFALVIKFADFGKPVAIQVPQDAITFEEFSALVMEMYMGNI